MMLVEEWVGSVVGETYFTAKFPIRCSRLFGLFHCSQSASHSGAMNLVRIFPVIWVGSSSCSNTMATCA